MGSVSHVLFWDWRGVSRRPTANYKLPLTRRICPVSGQRRLSLPRPCSVRRLDSIFLFLFSCNGSRPSVTVSAVRHNIKALNPRGAPSPHWLTVSAGSGGENGGHITQQHVLFKDLKFLWEGERGRMEGGESPIQLKKPWLTTLIFL